MWPGREPSYWEGVSAQKEIKCSLFNGTHLNILALDNGSLYVADANLSKLFSVNP